MIKNDKILSIMKFKSKLPHTPTSIFTRMSALAQQYNAINLSQGFPDFSVDTKLVDLVTRYMSEGFNQYAPMAGYMGLREQVAYKYADFYHIDVNPEAEVTITAGGTQGLFTVISTVIDKGDEVIIFEPAYDSYKPSVDLLGGKVIGIKLVAPDFKIDWQEVETCITDKTKLIIINNPNNPTGCVLDEDDISHLENIVLKHNILVLSDEVYEHLIFDGRKHLSVLKSDILRPNSFVVCSFGKLLHTTGWKVGYVIASSFYTEEFRRVHQFNVFSVNTPVQRAIASYLENRAYYYSLSGFFEKKRNILVEGLTGSNFETLSTAGTYFMLLDYSKISDELEMDFAERLTKEYKLAMIPVSSFYSSSDNQQLMRICFAKKDETLLSALEILSKI